MSVAPAQISAQLPRTAPLAAGDWWFEQGMSVSATRYIEDVADTWRRLEADGIESPGQSLDFTRAWIEQFKVPVERQLYVTAALNGKVVALLPLLRKQANGMNILTWFAGAHVGCNAPLIDRAAFAQLSAKDRAEFWRTLQRGFTDVDLVCLDAVPDFGDTGMFGEFGTSQPVEQMYRSEFDSWEECDSVQRSRSRRKHDRQQGAKLEAMGEVTFEELTEGPEAYEAIQTMFRQKAKRFQEWGVSDPFSVPDVRKFYASMLNQTGELQVRLHVLRLDGEIVAVRYNLAQGERVFSLISSMSNNEDLLPGSPGKQNLLRAQKHMFSTGIKMVDMGAGYSDEKRHWCNVSVPVRDHMLALTGRGRVIAGLMSWRMAALRRVKANPRLFNMAKWLRAFIGNAINRG